MKKDEEQQQIYELDDFEHHCHLWNIVPGGSGKGVIMLRKSVDSLQAGNHQNPYKKLPSFLLIGKKDSGKNLVARALVNSLALEDLRECPSQYFDCGIPSVQFFDTSLESTAHLITNIEQLSKPSEGTLWRYLKLSVCSYYNYVTHEQTVTQQIYGMIVMTSSLDKSKLSKSIIDVVDHVIELELYTIEQLKIIVHQLLKFSGTDYDGEQILQEIVEQGAGRIGQVIKFLKLCVVTMRADLGDFLDKKVVDKVKGMWESASVGAPPTEGKIPF